MLPVSSVHVLRSELRPNTAVFSFMVSAIKLRTHVLSSLFTMFFRALFSDLHLMPSVDFPAWNAPQIACWKVFWCSYAQGSVVPNREDKCVDKIPSGLHHSAISHTPKVNKSIWSNVPLIEINISITCSPWNVATGTHKEPNPVILLESRAHNLLLQCSRDLRRSHCICRIVIWFKNKSYVNMVIDKEVILTLILTDFYKWYDSGELASLSCPFPIIQNED